MLKLRLVKISSFSLDSNSISYLLFILFSDTYPTVISGSVEFCDDLSSRDLSLFEFDVPGLVFVVGLKDYGWVYYDWIGS